MAKKKTTRSTNTIEEYGKFLEDLEFITIRLLSASSRFDPKADALVRSKQDDRSVTLRLTTEYKLGTVESKYFEATGKLRLEVQGQKAKAKPVTVECVFEGHFHAGSNLSRDHAKRFTDQDFRLVLWPYFREFVQDTTARMAIRPIIIPLGIVREKNGQNS